MILSAFLVETLTVLVEPPPAIGGIVGKQQLALGKVQPQANLGVFMFLFMFCAIEVVFIKLISYATQSESDTNRSATVGTQTLSEEDELNNNNVAVGSVTPTEEQPNRG